MHKTLGFLRAICATAALLAAAHLAPAPANAGLVVNDGVVTIGNTNVAMPAVLGLAGGYVSLPEPVYVTAIALYNPGTNAVTAIVYEADLARTNAILTQALAANTACKAYITGIQTNYYSFGTNFTRYAVKDLRFALTKSAGNALDASTPVFYRIYGDTTR